MDQATPITRRILQKHGHGSLVPKLLPRLEALARIPGFRPNQYGAFPLGGLIPSGLVFRVENEAGKGPYTSGADRTYFRKHQASTSHPTPYASWGRCPYGDEFFGFTSIDALLRWFNVVEDLSVLGSLGFRLNIYHGEVSAICPQTEQCMFYKSRAKWEGWLLFDPSWHSL